MKIFIMVNQLKGKSLLRVPYYDIRYLEIILKSVLFHLFTLLIAVSRSMKLKKIDR
jgi:hypothetical protein